MSAKYLLLKCTDGRLSEALPPSRVLRLPEVRNIVEADAELVWIPDPKGAVGVRNSDGTVSEMRPHEGFTFTAGERTFVPCYEFYDGIAIHPKGDERAIAKARRIAAVLGASVYEL
jgi:hypothetical protein